MPVVIVIGWSWRETLFHDKNISAAESPAKLEIPAQISKGRRETVKNISNFVPLAAFGRNDPSLIGARAHQAKTFVSFVGAFEIAGHGLGG